MNLAPGFKLCNDFKWMKIGTCVENIGWKGFAASSTFEGTFVFGLKSVTAQLRSEKDGKMGHNSYTGTCLQLLSFQDMLLVMGKQSFCNDENKLKMHQLILNLCSYIGH